MDMFFRTDKSLVKMKDKIEVESRKMKDGSNESFLTTSDLGGKEVKVLAKFDNEKRALEILNRIDEILDKAIKNNANTVSINIPNDK